MSWKGKDAEGRACRLLKAEGFRIVARNWRCRFGEIDIIAREGATLVFIEVKARSGEGFGGAAGAVGRAKRRRLVATARWFMQEVGAELPARFDVMTFTGTSARLHRDAFRVDD